MSIVNSINPFRLQGQKTAAFEIIEELGDAPDLHLLPVGNAGNISAYWMGYREFHEAQKSTKLPQMLGFQAAGAAPIFHGKPVAAPETVATAIRIGNPASWHLASEALRISKGAIDIVTDLEILDAQRWLSSHEGIFVEPASAASIAGLLKCIATDASAAFPLAQVPENARIVCTVTGHGLKDPDIAREQCGSIIPAKAEKSEIMKLIG